MNRSRSGFWLGLGAGLMIGAFLSHLAGAPLEANLSSDASANLLRAAASANLPRSSALLEECPLHRTLLVTDASNASLSHFIEATLSALHHASLEVTRDSRPIHFLADNYDRFRSVDGGFWAEFGVFTGGTLLKAHSGLATQASFDGTIAGFDSFEGLPEAWRSGFGQGRFGLTEGKYEQVRARIPAEVQLYKGWFQDTIPGFLAERPGTPAAMIHHDGDLFLSTAITLQLLDKRIRPGTHMIFDELIGYPGYDKHEILALWLWMAQRKATLCAMGHKGPIDPTDVAREQHGDMQSAWFQVLDIEGDSPR